MKKKTLNKDIGTPFASRRDASLPLCYLMMLGAFSLVGLKVSGPDIEDTFEQLYGTVQCCGFICGSGLRIERRGPSRDQTRER